MGKGEGEVLKESCYTQILNAVFISSFLCKDIFKNQIMSILLHHSSRKANPDAPEKETFCLHKTPWASPVWAEITHFQWEQEYL